jgi:hypothetical protein
MKTLFDWQNLVWSALIISSSHHIIISLSHHVIISSSHHVIISSSHHVMFVIISSCIIMSQHVSSCAHQVWITLIMLALLGAGPLFGGFYTLSCPPLPYGPARKG